jgi:hypothetical protein
MDGIYYDVVMGFDGDIEPLMNANLIIDFFDRINKINRIFNRIYFNHGFSRISTDF